MRVGKLKTDASDPAPSPRRFSDPDPNNRPKGDHHVDHDFPPRSFERHRARGSGRVRARLRALREGLRHRRRALDGLRHLRQLQPRPAVRDPLPCEGEHRPQDRELDGKPEEHALLEGALDAPAPLQPEPSPLSHEAHEPEGLEGPRLGAHQLGRGLQDDRGEDARDAREVRTRERDVLRGRPEGAASRDLPPGALLRFHHLVHGVVGWVPLGLHDGRRTQLRLPQQRRHALGRHQGLSHSRDERLVAAPRLVEGDHGREGPRLQDHHDRLPPHEGGRDRGHSPAAPRRDRRRLGRGHVPRAHQGEPLRQGLRRGMDERF